MTHKPLSVCASSCRTRTRAGSRLDHVEEGVSLSVSVEADIVLRLFTDLIDKATKEIKQDDEQTVYKSLDEISDDLPDHSPRFVLLSYPMTLVRST